MRTLPSKIAEALAQLRSGDPAVFAGDYEVSGRVTVQQNPADPLGWWNTEVVDDLGTWPANKSPIRWWQDAANSQTEIELPRPIRIVRDRAIDQQAATVEVTFPNVKMVTPGTEPLDGQTGVPGYYWPTFGSSDEAKARWAQAVNAWQGVLLPNCLIRVYQGFGGEDLSIPDAITAGNLMLRFVGITDKPRGGTDGTIIIKARDMMRLLIEQDMVVPLIPLDEWPMVRQRWVYITVPANAKAIDIAAAFAGDLTPGDRRAVLTDSSGDHWYPQDTPGSEIPNGGADIHGHRPADALDPDPGTYWLSVGNSGPDKPFAFDFIEVDSGGDAVNTVGLQPWAGGYQMYVSIMENGLWQGADVIPYDPTDVFAGVGSPGQPYAVDTGAAIPYVAQFGVGWEDQGIVDYPLPRVYAAQRVRVTFTHDVETEFGPWVFRSGVRWFRPRLSNGPGTSLTVDTPTLHLPPLFLAADHHPDSGYWTCDTFVQVDGIGAARPEIVSWWSNPTGFKISQDTAVAIRGTPTGNGYYILHTNGIVEGFGDAAHFGDLTTDVDLTPITPSNIAFDMTLSYDGFGNVSGYWILQGDGTVHAYGAAQDLHRQVPVSSGGVATAIAGVGEDGFIVIDNLGVVHAYGSAPSHGSLSPLLPAMPPSIPGENAIDIKITHSGDGYWILTNVGHLHAFGDAPNLGDVAPLRVSDGDWRGGLWEIIQLSESDGDIGLMLLQGDGTVLPIGNIPLGDFYFGPVNGEDQQRIEGDYKDLSDIIEDIVLWSGFWLKETLEPTDKPSVFGTIETTGTYVNDILNADFFDKKHPVDVMQALADIVGYILGCREDGGVFWRSQNIWKSGNYDEDSNHSDVIPEVDERINLTAYAAELNADPIRSPIIIGSEDIDPHNPDQVMHVSYTPPWGDLLHGMIRPLQWTNGAFTDKETMQVMAELIALFIWFELRASSTSAWIDPSVEPDDQVRILERTTGETAIHYVRGINDTMDLSADGGGQWTMDLTTNWLGSADKWAITADDIGTSNGMPDQFQISQRLADWIKAAERNRSVAGHTTVDPSNDSPTTRSTASVDTSGNTQGPGDG